MNDMAFDDDGNQVPTVDFDYAALDAPTSSELSAADAARLRQQTLVRSLKFLCTGRCNPRTVGRRVMLLRHVITQEPPTQRELARMMAVSEARISAAVKSLKKELSEIA